MKIVSKIPTTYWLIGVLTLIGLVLRLINLDYLTLWVDEYIHAVPAKEWAEGRAYTPSENNGILLTYMISFFYKIFGVSDFWARFPSVLFGVGCIPLIYILGKRLFNDFVGVVSALLITVSLYHVYWSRIGRNYAIFVFFFLLMNILFLKAFESEEIKSKLSFFKKIKISPLYLGLFLVAVIFSFSAHPLTFFYFFGLAAYFILYFVSRAFFGVNKSFKDKYAILAYVSVLGMIFVFLPALTPVLKGILMNFMPENVVNNIVPNWDRVNKLLEDPKKKFEAYDIYKGVISADYTKIYFLGFIGFVLAFFINKKSALYIFGNFSIVFLLMSFVFREPALPRYHIYIYCYFLIAMAVSIFFFYDKLLRKILSQKMIESKVFYGVGILIILLLSPIKSTYSLVATQMHGRIADKALSHWYFTDWKAPLQNAKKQAKETDLFISTLIHPPMYYLGKKEDEIIHYRQRYYDGTKKGFVNYAVDTTTDNARSLQAVQKLFNKYPAGWFVVDYYFENAMADPATRDFVIKNTEYHYDLSNDDVNVLSWNRSKPITQRNSMLWVLGRKAEKIQSQEMQLNIGQKTRPQPIVVIEMEGLDYDIEASIIFNKKNQIYIRRDYGMNFKQTGNSSQRQYYQFSIDPSWIQAGTNSIIFSFNDKIIKENKKENKKGIVIYNFTIQA